MGFLDDNTKNKWDELTDALLSGARKHTLPLSQSSDVNVQNTEKLLEGVSDDEIGRYFDNYCRSDGRSCHDLLKALFHGSSPHTAAGTQRRISIVKTSLKVVRDSTCIDVVLTQIPSFFFFV